MGLKLDIAGLRELLKAVPEDTVYTHVVMSALRFTLPGVGRTLGAEFDWEIGIIHAATGKFLPITEPETEVVGAAATRAFLAGKDTRNKPTGHKLEEAMLNRLISKGRITAGTHVEIPE